LKAVIQRVFNASVSVDGVLKGAIDGGLLVYLGVASDDDARDAKWIADKIAFIRLFDDAKGRMNLSITDIVNCQPVNHSNDMVNGNIVNRTDFSVNGDVDNHANACVNELAVKCEKNTLNGDEMPVGSRIFTPIYGILVISQFTLLGDARKGRRPSWEKAAPPEMAKRLYEHCIACIRAHGLICETGVFQAHMEVKSINDGPVTILLDSKN
jgi:D-tyrosyl-tRNA(Tyr) deacylase